MNSSELIRQFGSGDALASLAQAMGLSKEQAEAILDSVAPAVVRGMQHNTRSDDGVSSLRDALQRGNHGRYLDDPAILGSDQAYKDGNDILGHVFGDRQVSRDVATHASNKTGIGQSIIEQALPLIASLLMGALSKQSNGGRDFGAPRMDSGPLGPLATIFDKDGDGQVIDDIIGMAGRQV
jgi:hypothetical protein